MTKKLGMLVALGFLSACASGTSGPTTIEAPGSVKPAWFGLVPPAALAEPEIAPPADATIPPAIVPAGETGRAALEGTRIRQSVEQVVGFAHDMQTSGNQMWGRISGLPSQASTADWLANEFETIPLAGIQTQTYKASSDFWWPEKWEARVLSNPAYGDQSIDVVLESAMPVSRSAITGGKLEAAVVFAGEAGSVSTDGVSGKIAIQHSRPSTGAYSDRAKIRDSSAALIKAGAVAVLNWVEQGGNMHVYDFGGCGGPCFNIGGADGTFLTQAIKMAKDKGAPEIRMSLSLEASIKTGLTARNVFGLIPGASDEIVIVNAHLDSWFDGAGDNADGVGVMLALARYYGRMDGKPARTLMFVGSGGHHSPGMNGPQNLVAMNPELMKHVVLVINLEHLAQYEIQAVPTWQVKTSEEPKNFGVSNMSPFLVNLVKEAAKRYGFVIQPDITNSVPGDLGGYAPLGVARMQGIHSGPLYHTSGDEMTSISTPGLEKAARFYAYVIDAMMKAKATDINPPGSKG